MAGTYVEFGWLMAGPRGLFWLGGCRVCGAVEGPFVDPDDAADWANTHRCRRGAR